MHTDPIFVTRIEDRQGNLIASFIPPVAGRRERTHGLHDAHHAARRGQFRTAGRLKWQFGFEDMEIGGKTGTSNKNRDAWFVCVAPKLVTSAWVGGEDQSVHRISGGEGSVMALPIVGEFMKSVYGDGRLGISREDKFARPTLMPRYDCDEQPEGADERASETGIAEDDAFFD